jgi:hypothetical protein
MTRQIELQENLEFIDSYANDLGEQSSSGTVSLFYEKNLDKKGFGEVTTRGKDLKLQYPVETVSELNHLQHLSSQIRRINRQQSDYIDKVGTTVLPQVFDEALLNVSARALNQEINSLDDVPATESYIKALLIHDAWGMESFPQLERHLEENEYIARQIGFESVPDQSRFWQISKKSEEDWNWRERIQNAALRAVHAVFRQGVSLPSDVQPYHGINYHSTIDEQTIPGKTKRAALLNWMDFLVPELTEPISFDRENNLRYTVKQIIGGLAFASLIDGFSSAKSVAPWFYQEDQIISPTQLKNLMKQFENPFETMLRMFTDVNLRFIKIGSDLGFFKNSYDFGLDTTWITWKGKGDNIEMELSNNPKRCSSGRGWCFAALNILDLESRFTLGIDLVTERSQTKGQFHNLLRIAAREGKVGRIHADRGFYGGKTVKICRAISGPNYALRVEHQDKGEIGGHMDAVEEGEDKFVPNVDFAELPKKPNLYIHPIPEKYQEGNSHMGFLTGLSPEDTDLSSIYSRYAKRWSVETFFRQAKHNFIPNTQSSYPEIRAFLFNIGTLFYNIHTMINRSRSPEYGLRIDAGYYEILVALVEYVFTRSRPTD